MTYRTADELELYKQRDPIAALRKAIVDGGIASEDELNAIDARVTEQLDDAWVPRLRPRHSQNRKRH